MDLTENPLLTLIEAAEQALNGERGEKKLFLSTKRRCYYWGCFNASQGSMRYAGNFFSRSGSSFDDVSAQNKIHRAAFWAGLRRYICTSVQFNGGISDTFSLLCSDAINRSAYRDEAWRTFVKGFERGFDKIFYHENLSQISVSAFLLAAGEQARRKDSITLPVPPHIVWPDQNPERYQQILTAIKEIFPRCDQTALLFKFLESFPRTKNAKEYQSLIDNHTALSLINHSKTLAELNFISHTLPDFFNPRSNLLATKLEEKAHSLCSGFFNEQDSRSSDNYGYCMASQIERRPSGLVGNTLEYYEEKYDATSVEVSTQENMYRVFLVFNSITGPCVIHCGLDDIRCGISIATLRTQEEMPDCYLPQNKFSFGFADGNSEEMIKQAREMIEELDALEVKKRRETYQHLRDDLPAFQQAAVTIGRSLE